MIDASLIFDGTLPNTGVAVVATQPSTNVLDLGADRDIGSTGQINFNILITVAFATATSVQIAIQSSADNSSFVDLLLSPVMLIAGLTAGVKLVYKLPRKQLNDPAGGTPNRYLRLNYVVAGSNATAGKVFSWMTVDEDYDVGHTYPRGYNVASGS